jgi:fucose 4-O-acetylase-like acetyltransferase
MDEAAEVPKDGGNTRLRILDVYKGIAILGVIITHVVLLQNGMGGKAGDTSAIVQFLFSGLIMFMVISGYFYKPGSSFLHNVKKRVVTLLVVYFAAIVVMTSVMYLYLLIIGYDLSSYDLVDVIVKVAFGKANFVDMTSDEFFDLMQPMAPFEVTVMMYYLGILADRVLKDWRMAVVAILILFGITSLYMEFVHIQLPLFAYYAPMVAGFLLVGALLSKVRFAEMLETGYRTRNFWLVLIIATVLSALCLLLFPAQTDVVYGRIGTGPLRVYTFAATSLSCGIVQLYVVLLLSKIPGVSHLFNDMGKNIIYLFLLHMLVAKMLIAPFVELPADKFIPLGFMPALALAFGTIAVILVISHIYRRIRPGLIEKVSTAGRNPKAQQ